MFEKSEKILDLSEKLMDCARKDRIQSVPRR